jgi:hypothetical protein
LLYRRAAAPGGRIAQLVEQLTLNQRVAGSSPAAPTNRFNGLGRGPENKGGLSEGSSEINVPTAFATGEMSMADRYTKGVPTVIAIGLLALVAQNGLRLARAQSLEPMQVEICGGAGNCAYVDRGRLMVATP